MNTNLSIRAALAVRRHNEVPIRSLRFLLFSSQNNFGARNLVGVAGHVRRSKNTHTHSCAAARECKEHKASSSVNIP
jgi:hypothetical protein